MTTTLRLLAALPAVLCTLFIYPSPLISQSPDTIRAGSRGLGKHPLPLGTDTIFSEVRENGASTPLNISILTISDGGDGPEGAWRVDIVHRSLPSNDVTSTSILLRKSDYSLIHHKVSAPGDSAAVTASRRRLTGWVVLPDEPVSLFDIELSRPVLPVDGPAPWFFSILPLRDGYTAVVPRFSMWNRGEVWKTYMVVGSEFVGAGEATSECWKIDAGPLGPPGYTAFSWVDKSTRRVVQSALLNPSGGKEYWSTTRGGGR